MEEIYQSLDESLKRACDSDNVESIRQHLHISNRLDDTSLLLQVFLYAAAHDAPEIVSYILNFGANVRHAELSYMFAFGSISSSVLTVLTENGCGFGDIPIEELRDWYTPQPLSRKVCETDDVPYFKRVLEWEREQFGPPDRLDGSPGTAKTALNYVLQVAVDEKALKVLEHALANGADVGYIRHLAIGGAEVSLECVEILQRYGFDVNSARPNLLASVAGDESKVRWALDHGAVITKDSTGLLDVVAMKGGSPATFKLVYSYGAPAAPLLIHTVVSLAVKYAEQENTQKFAEAMEMLKFLTDEVKVDVNVVDYPPDGPEPSLIALQSLKGSPLHCAVEAQGDGLEVVRLLLSRGANPDVPDYYGYSALQVAKAKQRQSFLDCVRMDHSDKDTGEL